MHAIIESNCKAVIDLCRRFHMKRLNVFGSGALDTSTSDVDLLAELLDPPDTNRADQYFGLLLALEDVFRRPVDLVCARGIRSPYFRRRVDETKVVVDAA